MTRSHSDCFRNHSVDLKRKTAEVSSRPQTQKVSRSRKAARKDSAVHVSLSSDSPVKQPGTEPVPSPSKESRRSPRFRGHRKLVHRISVRSFAGALSRRSRQRAVRAVYRTRPRTLSTPKPAESAWISYFSTLTRTRRRPDATGSLFLRGLTIIRWGEEATDSTELAPY